MFMFYCLSLCDDAIVVHGVFLADILYCWYLTNTLENKDSVGYVLCSVCNVASI